MQSGKQQLSDRAVARLVRADGTGDVVLPKCSNRQIRRRLRRARAMAALGSLTSDLILQRPGRDRWEPDIRLNWRHPLALPFCCILLAAVPCLVVWRLAETGMRWHARRARKSERSKIRA